MYYTAQAIWKQVIGTLHSTVIFWTPLHTEGFTTAWEDSSFGRVFATKAWGHVSHPCFHEDMCPIPASVLKGRPGGMDAFVTLHPGVRDGRMNSWASLTSQTSWVSELQIREILSQEVRWGIEWELTSQTCVAIVDLGFILRTQMVTHDCL